MRAMYAYLDENPQRAAARFNALFSEGDQEQPVLLTETEMNLEESARRSIENLAFGEHDTEDLEREADLVFNPFPATLVVRVPTEPLIVEGFTREEKGRLVAHTMDLLDAVASLEGKWI